MKPPENPNAVAHFKVYIEKRNDDADIYRVILPEDSHIIEGLLTEALDNGWDISMQAITEGDLYDEYIEKSDECV
jgi:hypothetical protein